MSTSKIGLKMGLWREKVDQHSTGTVSTVWQVSWEDEEDGGNPDG